MHWLRTQALPHPIRDLMFRPAPAAGSAWVSALLEPIVFIVVFLFLALIEPSARRVLESMAPPLIGSTTPLHDPVRVRHVISDVDWGLMLLVLALTFPAPDQLFASRWQRWSKAVINTTMLALVLVLCAWVTRGLQAMNHVLWTAWLVLTPLVQEAAVSVVSAGWIRWAKRTQAPRVIVVGRGPMGVRVARALRRIRGIQAQRFIGWIDLAEETTAGTHHRYARGRKPFRLGGLAELERLLRNGLVDQVYLTGTADKSHGTERAERKFTRLWTALADSTVTVRWVPDLLQPVVLQGQVTTLDGLPLIGLLESPYSGVRAASKRVSDLAVATIALLMASPLMLLIATLIRLQSPGPVIFRQRRLGLNGQVIEVWKFRTMSVMEDGAEIRQVKRDDERVTPLGRLLRRTSLDELPQFVNVLQGRMSVVGPRPHALAHNELYRGQVKAYMIRHKVRPGITGWAQVNGFRGETETVDKMRRRVEHDLYYLQNWSLSMDLQIILRTIALVFRDATAW